MTEHQNTLNILQYNVMKSRNIVMIPLFEDERTGKYDIIAIQEPWKNPFSNTTYKQTHQRFVLEYMDHRETRVCFFINKRIDPKTWKVTHHTPDLATVHLTVKGDGNTPRTINIHNIYKPPSREDYQGEEDILDNLNEALQGRGEHVLLGDLNMFHPLWSDPLSTRYHARAEVLVEYMEQHAMILALPKGTITRERNEDRPATLDLVFIPRELEEKVIKCRAATELDHDSDHYPVETVLDLEHTYNTPRQTRRWKSTDIKKLTGTLSEKLPSIAPLEDRENLDRFTEGIVQAIETAIDASTPWGNVTPYSKTYWTELCTQAVKEARREKRRWKRERSIESWETYQSARNRKRNVLRKHKTDEHRQRVVEASETPNGLWKIAKWAKARTSNSQANTRLPPLLMEGQIANTTDEKIHTLSLSFFPSPPEPNTEDIDEFQYPQEIQTPPDITQREVEIAIERTAPRKAPGLDGIPNHILKTLKIQLSGHLTHLFRASLRQGYYPNHFKQSNTIVLRKEGKDDYTNPKAYRPIALLNTIGKIMEAVMARRINELVEQHLLLPQTHMGGRKMTSVETAVQLLTEKTHAAWKRKGRCVASILSLDVQGAFDNVWHKRLIHNLRKRRIPDNIVKWTESMVNERVTYITLEGERSRPIRRNTGIPQGSPLSPILYLFYNADLLDITNKPSLRVSSSGFIDDVNIFTFGSSTEENCETLRQTHEDCLKWATQHGSKFAPAKYELVHLTRTPRKFKMDAALELPQATVHPKTAIKLLGLYLDTSLNWQVQVNHMISKVKKRIGVLSSLTASTWGSTIAKAKQIYTTMIRPIITFGSPIWSSPRGCKGHRKGQLNKLKSLQYQSLRIASGAFKATSGPALDIETYTLPIELQVKKELLRSILRILSSPKLEVINSQVGAIHNFQAGNSRPTPMGLRKDTPLLLKIEWAKLHFGVENVEKRKPYTSPPWWNPPNTTIHPTAKLATIHHNQRSCKKGHICIYTDGSGYKNGIGASAVLGITTFKEYLGTASQATVFTAELKGVDLATKMIGIVAEKDTKRIIKGFDIFTDNQAAIRAIKKGDTGSGQSILRSIVTKLTNIREKAPYEISIYWIPAHTGVRGNEEADKAAREAADAPEDIRTKASEIAIRYESAVKMEASRTLRRVWKEQWEKEMKGRHTYRITPSPTGKTLDLHEGLPKALSSIGIQLRTGKIGLNEFLHTRRVPGYESPQCECGHGNQSVIHMLTACRKWVRERWELRVSSGSLDLATILGNRDSFRAAIQFILATGKLNQFREVREKLSPA